MGRGEARDALKLATHCVQELKSADDNSALAFSLYWQSACEWNLGCFDDALCHAEQGFTLARQIDDQHAELLNLRQIGQSLVHLDRAAEGIEACEHAVRLAQELGQDSFEAAAKQTLAHVCVITGDHAKALTLARNLLDLNRRLDNVRGVGVSLGVLGDAYCGLARYQEAAEVLTEALPIFRDHANRRYQGLCLLKLGYAYQGMGQYQKATEHLKDSLRIFHGLGLKHYEQRAQETLELCLFADR